ncbi:MAG: zinc ribbon domain-containing protein [Peptococcaceae bacterium]|nr:zinc ribbon domain-containing protein [Peptococcaceae bacterium]
MDALPRAAAVLSAALLPFQMLMDAGAARLWVYLAFHAANGVCVACGFRLFCFACNNCERLFAALAALDMVYYIIMLMTLYIEYDEGRVGSAVYGMGGFAAIAVVFAVQLWFNRSALHIWNLFLALTVLGLAGLLSDSAFLLNAGSFLYGAGDGMGYVVIFYTLGGFGGILGGIAKSVVPKDTPEGKLLAAQSELSDLRKQESEILLEIGQQAYERNPGEWPQDAKLKLIRENIAAAQSALNEAKTAQEQAESAKAAEDAKGRCPSCGHKNPDGVKFCQECGTPLAAAGPRHCPACGGSLAAGTRFCGECGAPVGGSD